MALFHRIYRENSTRIGFFIDGFLVEGRAGDSILTAMLTAGETIRRSEFSGSPRAGFCQMGACQDCWVTLEDGTRLRACTTPLTDGLRIVTGAAR
jgi:predicted molibdopterin-dependent oxidoreductase YjgC